MQNNPATPPKKSFLKKMIITVFALGITGLVMWNLPRGFSVDLAQIGQGENIVVQVHDHDLVNSGGLMENINKVRPEYKGVIKFLVADLKAPEGQAFAKVYNVDAVTLVFFAPDGTKLGVVQGVPELDALRSTLNQVFNLSSLKK